MLKAGQQVAESCKGLPLVIVLTAGIIAEKRQASLWLEVANDLSSHVLEEQSTKIIESSYDHLEDHLKACLLYMGLFPEDYKIPVCDLLKLWIAENFVQNMDTDNLEEASKICLNGLVTRSLVVVTKRRSNGEIKYCTVHDLVREFCLRKLTKEKFMQLIVPYNRYQTLGAKEPRLCMYVHDDLVRELVQYEYSLDKIPMMAGLKEGESFAQCHDRSLEFIAHPKFYAWDHISLFPLLDNFRLIRVLHLWDIYLQNSWATAMQAVTHLRYLAIFTQKFDFQWISHLLDLQNLRVAWKDSTALDPTMRLKTSPAIWKMQKLRHVDINKFSFAWKDNDRAIFEESPKPVLPNLKTFGKCWIYLADMTPEFWWRFPNIEQLKLHFVEPEDETVTKYYEVPTPEVDMPNLEKLPLQSLEVSFSHTKSTYSTMMGQLCCLPFKSKTFVH
ncbi:putative late blight resistance protein homolog R1B-23 [Nicotiana sylvestris]|uniref:Late blight resistance protein homolog R1B-23 n=2 Tax=Nicotiana TaxID=4085 RepID=A0A1S4BSL4_TOBAC|nr:PREDICTED: putative late blight resistance protein homolog R1B-23 [Nicotiana sylvestris]XP_009802324.1 PREDICTED: putative late blight resistance protein homolog R1B-23 [Nicotiana sylvestris]XP_009802326.1 PREDICTED: putative late blight resistance protein homolog R1B-23 [Nicotiana sylvestris]XP_016491885.1 PREDICTED: putative late blight resistance protein homolog R1B-23 [Nicotiana tabacum]